MPVLRSWPTVADCPPELRGLLSPYLRLDRYGKLRLLVQYLANHGGSHRLLLKTPGSERALRYLPASDDAARTELDAGPDGVRAAKVKGAETPPTAHRRICILGSNDLLSSRSGSGERHRL